jgi:hypothetical protein
LDFRWIRLSVYAGPAPEARDFGELLIADLKLLIANPASALGRHSKKSAISD